MPNWRTVDENDLAATVSQREIDTFRRSGPVDGSDPVARLLQSTVEAVRGYISCNSAVRMGPAGTIPNGLIVPAMDYAAAKMLGRYDKEPNEARQHALEAAERLFEKIAQGVVTPESYTEDGSIDEDKRPATSPMADDGARPVLGGGLWCIAFALLAACSGLAKTFDVDVSTGRPAPANEAFYHGETIVFRPVRGKAPVTNVAYSAVYYQTNGMGGAWWKADGLELHPTNDCGASSYRFFLEGRDDDGRDWHANGTLRMLDSPGFVPNALPLPVSVLDFATIEVANAPFTTPADVCGIVTNVTRHAEDWPNMGWSEILWHNGKWTLCDIYEGEVLVLEVAQEPNASDYWASDLEFPSYMWQASRTVTTANALGMARREDIPDNIVTADNIESEVTRQLDGVDQVRSRRVLREDGPGEYGTGPGVMIYDFTSDLRWWELVSPTFSSVSVNAPSPLSNLAPGSHVSRRLVRTDGATGADRCASATWRVGVVELNDGSYGLDVTATVTNGTVGVSSASGGGPGADVTYVYNAYYNYYYSFKNFRVGSVVTNSQYSVTVNGLYDYRHKSGYNTSNFYSNQTWSVTVNSSAGAYATTTNEYLRVINGATKDLYWDGALGVTWRIGVTNGSFYSEAVSTNNILGGWAP